MIYLYIGDNQIKLLFLKKTLLGQHETFFFEKKHEIKLLEKGHVTNIDLLASSIKEALTQASPNPIDKREVFLILPQEVFYFLRTEVPVDIAQSAMSSFIYDKARASLPVAIDDCLSDFFIQENQKQKILSFFALEKDVLEDFRRALALIGLRITFVLPDTLSYFKLFEKTLRREKRENIFYVTYEKSAISGYLFDSFGLTSQEKLHLGLKDNLTIEEALKKQVSEFENKANRLNRIILSGADSENIRQDTFTKSVGVWTNPLKRIIPDFYQDYLKLIIVNQNKKFPILNLDVCFGAFIFHQENKNFSLLKNGAKLLRKKGPIRLPSLSIPKKEIFIFISSFVLSFLFFLFISKSGLNSLPFKIPKMGAEQIAKTSPSPLPPTPTPTLSIKKEEIKIKILNGSGVAGKAGELKDALKNKGYQEILVGNADNFDYEQSELAVKKSKSEIANLIKNDLGEYIKIAKQTELAEEESADATITFGADFK